MPIPFSLQLVDLSAAQDVEAGDGTTSVVVLAGSFLGAAEKMLGKGTLLFSLKGPSLTLARNPPNNHRRVLHKSLAKSR